MSEWISVNDRLPPEEEKVLTYDRRGHMRDRFIRRFINGFTAFYPDGLRVGTDITHWMPLPEPPKEE